MKKEIKRTAFFLALVLLAVKSDVFAQNDAAASRTISVAQILEGNLAATGGLDAHKAVRTLKATGNIKLPNNYILGDYVFLYKAPAADLLRVQVISHGTTWTGHWNEERIQRSTGQGAKVMNGAGMEIVEQCMMSLLEWDVRDYSKVELIGKAQVQDRLALALRFTPKKGDPQVRYYDTETFLLVRMDQVQRLPQPRGLPEGLYAVTTYFQNYRQFGSLKLPGRIAVSHTMDDLIFELASVKTDEKIPESAFHD
jgi:hypothetical protein